MDISNKTLALFLVGAIVLSLGGTLFALNQLAKVTGPTGFAPANTSSGQVNFTIYAASDIYVENNTLDFGVGIVNRSRSDVNCSVAYLSNNVSNGTTKGGENYKNCWATNSSETGAASGRSASVNVTGEHFAVRNDGNINITLAMRSLKHNASDFIGNCSHEVANYYNYTSYINGTSAGALLYTCQGPTNKMGRWEAINESNLVICRELAWEDGTDAMAVAFNFSICASNDATGLRSDDLYFVTAAAP